MNAPLIASFRGRPSWLRSGGLAGIEMMQSFREGHKKSSVGFQKISWGETEKQKARRCRAQEFGPKQCPEMSGRKRNSLFESRKIACW